MFRVFGADEAIRFAFETVLDYFLLQRLSLITFLCAVFFSFVFIYKQMDNVSCFYLRNKEILHLHFTEVRAN